ncbi:MAG TPA: GyrI-like domain-containing protein [Pyrinomonadaceae bacterium]
MNKARLFVIGAFLASALLIGLTQGATTAHPSVDSGDGDGRVAGTAIVNTDPVSFWAVTWDTTGSFDTMGEAVDRFTKETFNQNVEARLQSPPEAIIILREDPRGKALFRYAVGLRVPNRMAVGDPLKIEEVRLAQATTVAHTGPYQELQSVYETLESSGRARGWPVIMVLDNDPRQISPSEIRTRLIAPF